MSRDHIQLFDESLIDDNPQLARDVLGFTTRYGHGLGWHYLLDLIWILKELNLPPRSTILDAGAGSGLLQYILIELGYNVVSVDMSAGRVVHPLAYKIARVEIAQENDDIHHHYIDHNEPKRVSAPSPAVPALPTPDVVSRVLQTPIGQVPRKALRLLTKPLRKSLSAAPAPTAPELLTPSRNVQPDVLEVEADSRPALRFHKADLRNMGGVADASMDAALSVSAIEHNRAEEVQRIVSELERVVKPGGLMLLTVSASHPESSFHEPSHSWLLNEPDLAKLYRLAPDYTSNFDRFDEIFENLKNSRYLCRWLGHSYYAGDKNGMPLGQWDPCYVPLGIRRQIV